MPIYNMTLMYGVPPDLGSPRYEPAQPQPGPIGILGIPPITHNPFTGEPVNVLEMLTRNAFLEDENKRLTALCEEQTKKANELAVRVLTLEAQGVKRKKTKK
jgi:hypothetical protein